MKKEQILLLVSVGVAGLLVWSSTGLYASVEPSKIPVGKDVATKAALPADPRMGLMENPPVGRNYLRQRRVERRKEPPELDLPPPLGLPWVRPLPWPYLPPSFWGLLREEDRRVVRPSEEKAPDTGDAQPNEDQDPVAKAIAEAAADKAKADAAARARIEDAAQLVVSGRTPTPVRLTPLGADQGQPVWVILEKWPNVRFLVEELNADGKTVRGKYEVGPAEVERFQTVHLEKTLENEYNEERIRRGVKATDRTANIEFAGWIRQGLAQKYGVPAVRLALTHLNVARAIQLDSALVLLIGDTCQEAFDLDEEIKAYRDYLQGARATEANVIVRLGDAYERGGALHEAKAQFEKAAKLGDTEGRLRMAALMLALAEDTAGLDAAFDEYQKSQGAQTGQRARALAGMARVSLRRGDVAGALKLAADAKAADAASFDAHIVLGAALYASGKFADAEQAFAAAAPLERSQNTHARSNRAMALLAQDKLPEAITEAQACLDADPLNYFDPLLVLAEAQQRWGDLTKSSDGFQTALTRNPRNAWILLRLAAIRLRDGAPGKALEIVRGVEGSIGLLQLAPESVDALHMAGLACAGQETPDWPGALKYLGRALDKEPKNLDLIYDLAKALHLAGRTDEAIQLLERTTDSNTGAAKNDARCLALLAYIYFDGGKPVDLTFATLDRAKRAAQSSWTKEWVEKTYQKVVDWNNTRVWEDDFKRPAGGTVRNGWEEFEVLGVQINLDGDRCIFNGRAIPAQERARYTGLTRSEELAGLLATDVVVKADTGFEFVVHLYAGELPPIDVATGSGAGGGGKPPRRSVASELGFGADRAGRMMLWVYSGGSKMFNIAVKNADGTDRAWPTDGNFHHISFRRVLGEPGAGTKGGFEIYLDDEKIPTPEPIEIGGLGTQAGKSATLGVHVDADQGAQVNLLIDSVQVEKILGKR